MTSARRTSPLFVRLDAQAAVDVAALLRGEARLVRRGRITALSPVTGRQAEIGEDDLRLLLALPTEGWLEAAELDDGDGERLGRLVELGLAAARGDDVPAAVERVLEMWGPQAALVHASTRRRDVDLKRAVEAAAEPPVSPAAEFTAHAATHGPPPAHFHAAPNPRASVELPPPRTAGALEEIFARRRTTRSFDAEAMLSAADLGLVLHHAFGASGTLVAGPLTLLHKASPSGGGLHPVEAYPLVTRVEGIEPGLYHYDLRRHALGLLEQLDRRPADDLVDLFTQGQSYFRGVHALVLLTARFERTFWKYRGDDRAYAVALLDAGHAAQTLQLVCAERGLGAFVTAAINQVNVDERLGLDGFAEGSIAACGVGVPGSPHPLLDPEFEPFAPR